MYDAPVLVDLQEVLGQDTEPIYESCGFICITGGESVVTGTICRSFI